MKIFSQHMVKKAHNIALIWVNVNMNINYINRFTLKSVETVQIYLYQNDYEL